jgi:hypothetical protein
MEIKMAQAIGWSIDGSIQNVDDLQERVITTLESLESLLSEAKHSKRYDVIHKTIKTFAALNMVLVKDAAAEYQQQNPGESIQ